MGSPADPGVVQERGGGCERAGRLLQAELGAGARPARAARAARRAGGGGAARAGPRRRALPG